VVVAVCIPKRRLIKHGGASYRGPTGKFGSEGVVWTHDGEEEETGGGLAEW
jgi:hypothetical protein